MEVCKTQDLIGSCIDASHVSALMTVRWTAAIMLNGSTMSISPAEIVPDIQFAKYPNELGKSICSKTFANLQKEFPRVIDFDNIVKELGESLRRCSANLHTTSRELCVTNPVFNRYGDLLLELATADQQSSEGVSRSSYPRMNGVLSRERCKYRSFG